MKIQIKLPDFQTAAYSTPVRALWAGEGAQVRADVLHMQNICMKACPLQKHSDHRRTWEVLMLR